MTHVSDHAGSQLYLQFHKLPTLLNTVGPLSGIPSKFKLLPGHGTLPGHDRPCRSSGLASTQALHCIAKAHAHQIARKAHHLGDEVHSSWHCGHLKVVQLLGDLLASLPDKQLLAFKDGRLKLLEAKETRDGLKLAKEPLAQPIVIRGKVPGACTCQVAPVNGLCQVGSTTAPALHSRAGISGKPQGKHAACTSNWLRFNEASVRFLCFADANLTILSPSLHDMQATCS